MDLRQPESAGGATSSDEYASVHNPSDVTTSESDNPLEPIREDHPHQPESGGATSSNEYASGHHPNDVSDLEKKKDEATRLERERLRDWLYSTTQKSGNTIPDFLLSENRIYQTDESSKGLVAIINNFTIASDPNYRGGTMVDEDTVRRLFTAGPFADAYELLDPARDLSSDQFALYLDELVTRLKTGSYHSFMLFIMSHGNENGVYTYDLRTISTEEITAKFDNVLLGQPRVFFINGCQGSNLQMIEGGMMTLDRKLTEFKIECRMKIVESNHSITPRGCDMLVAFASVTGYDAIGTLEQGSWYIATLVDVISQASNAGLFNMDIEEILTIVNHQLADKKVQGRR